MQVKHPPDTMEHLEKFEKLVEIMDRLREPDGCPWDREQDYESLRGYLLEEAYEVAETLDDLDEEGLREELGDLLFQIVFLSRIAKERGRFTIDDVVRGIGEKMIRRHPHVFGDATVADSEEVLRNWEAIKREEKPHRATASTLAGIPRGLPALLRAGRLGAKAARVGFDWDRPEQVLEKVTEELGELRVAMDERDRGAIREEIGDLLFAVTMLARKLEIDPEGALQSSNAKFVRRFSWVERRLADEQTSMEETDLKRLEQLWQKAKQQAGKADR